METVKVARDGALRVTVDGAPLVLGGLQVRIPHALWQTASGALPTATIAAVLWHVPLDPTSTPRC